jgi:hypothetical protein
MRRKLAREQGLAAPASSTSPFRHPSSYREMSAILDSEFGPCDALDSERFVLFVALGGSGIKMRVRDYFKDWNPLIEFMPEDGETVGGLHYEVNSKVVYMGMSPYPLVGKKFATTRDRVPFVTYTLSGRRLFSGEAKERLCVECNF